MSTVTDVPLDMLPERYRALLLRFEAVRPDCARVARLAIARGEQTDRAGHVEVDVTDYLYLQDLNNVVRKMKRYLAISPRLPPG